MKKNLPLFISAAITLCIMMGISFTIPDAQQAHSTRIVGIIIAAVIAAIAIYNIDQWSLTKRTIVHTIAMAIIVLPCLVLSNWFDLNTPLGIFFLAAQFIGFGIVGWTIGYIVHRSSEKRSTKA